MRPLQRFKKRGRASIKDHAGEVDGVIEKRICGSFKELLEDVEFSKGKLVFSWRPEWETYLYASYWVCELQRGEKVS